MFEGDTLSIDKKNLVIRTQSVPSLGMFVEETVRPENTDDRFEFVLFSNFIPPYISIMIWVISIWVLIPVRVRTIFGAVKE
jgi:hypothetical protein